MLVERLIGHIHGWGSKKEWPIKKGLWKRNLDFHNVYKYYNRSFFLVFTIKILLVFKQGKISINVLDIV
jgi:hypothetical protein